jgi:transglutaminase-like putative cysteine protease
MRLRVQHETTYHFDPPMRGVVQAHRLTPSLFEGQQVIDWTVTVDGAVDAAVRGAGFRDGAGDWIETVSLLGPVAEMTVEVAGEVETVDMSGVLRGHRESVPPMTYLRPTRATRADKALSELAGDAVAGIAPGAVLERAHALAAAVSDAIAYRPGETEHGTTAAEALALGQGVCQDHAHALIAGALTLDIPGRYVIGYLFATEEDGVHEASHAWAELWIEGLGWIGFDPSNRSCPDERYIRLGSGADATEAAPIRGVAQGLGREWLDVRVVVDQAVQSQSQ